MTAIYIVVKGDFMRKIISIALFLILGAMAQGFVPSTSTGTFSPSTSVGDWDAFAWDWSGYDDQQIEATFVAAYTSTGQVTFRLSYPLRGEWYLTVNNSILSAASSNSFLSVMNVARTNIPPVKNYYAEFLYTEDGETRTLAKGRVNVSWSLYQGTNEASFVPASITYSITKSYTILGISNYVAKVGDEMTGNLIMSNNAAIVFRNGGRIEGIGYSGAGTTNVIIDADGNVGIKTTSLTKELTVNGDVIANSYYGNAATLTNYTESDAIFVESVAGGITTNDTANWDTAYGWENHATSGYASVSYADGLASGLSVVDVAIYAAASNAASTGALNAVAATVGVASNTLNTRIASLSNGLISANAQITSTSGTVYTLGIQLAAASNKANTAYGWGNPATNTYTAKSYVDGISNGLHTIDLSLQSQINTLSGTGDVAELDSRIYILEGRTSTYNKASTDAIAATNWIGTNSARITTIEVLGSNTASSLTAYKTIALTNNQTNITLKGTFVGNGAGLTNIPFASATNVATWSTFPATANINAGENHLTNVDSIAASGLITASSMHISTATIEEFSGDDINFNGGVLYDLIVSNATYYGNGAGITNIPIQTSVSVGYGLEGTGSTGDLLRIDSDAVVTNELDPVFSTWIGTNTYVQSETDPYALYLNGTKSMTGNILLGTNYGAAPSVAFSRGAGVLARDYLSSTGSVLRYNGVAIVSNGGIVVPLVGDVTGTSASNVLGYSVVKLSNVDVDSLSSEFMRSGSINRFDKLLVADEAALGSEIVSNGTFASGEAYWAFSGVAYIAGSRAQVVDGLSGVIVYTNYTIVSNAYYKLSFEKGGTNGSLTAYLGTDSYTPSSSSYGTMVKYFESDGVGSQLTFAISANAGVTAYQYVDSVSLKRVTNGELRVVGNLFIDGKLHGDGSSLTGISVANSITNNQTGVTLSGTFAGTHTGSGSGLTSLPASVVTNNAPSVTLGGTFAGTHTGSGSGLTSVPSFVVTNGQTNVTLGGNFSGTYTGTYNGAVGISMYGNALPTNDTAAQNYAFSDTAPFINLNPLCKPVWTNRTIVFTNSTDPVLLFTSIPIVSGNSYRVSGVVTGSTLYFRQMSIGGITNYLSGNNTNYTGLYAAINTNSLRMVFYIAADPLAFPPAYLTNLSFSSYSSNDIGRLWNDHGTMKLMGY